jgi:hypothetical protein
MFIHQDGQNPSDYNNIFNTCLPEVAFTAVVLAGFEYGLHRQQIILTVINSNIFGFMAFYL